MFDFSAFFSPSSQGDDLNLFPKLDWEHLFSDQRWKIEGLVDERAVLAERVAVGLETRIDPFVVIEDDVVIGKNCLIRSGALVRRGTIIADNVVIGHGSEIKHSYLFQQVKVGSHCFVGDSILGKGARVGSGVITGNRRFDQEEIFWYGQESKHESGQDKIGLVLGEYCRLGAHVTTAPGTMIGYQTWVSPARMVQGFIPKQTFIKPNGDMVDNRYAKLLHTVDKEGNR